MQFDCNNIREIIEADFDLQFDEELFLQHVESCPNCKTLFELKPEMEDRLAKLLVHPAPASLAGNILRIARASEKAPKIDKIYEAVQWAASVISIAIAIIIFIQNRNAIVSIFNLNKIQSAANDIISLLHPLESLKSNLNSGALVIANSPLTLTALVGTVALIWAYCILKFRETIK